MKAILLITTLLTAFGGVLVFQAAESAIHEILAVSLWVISAIHLAAFAILEAIERLIKATENNYTAIRALAREMGRKNGE